MALSRCVEEVSSSGRRVGCPASQDLDYFHELIFVDELARCLGVSHKSIQIPQTTTHHKVQS